MLESRRYILRAEELRRPCGVMERPESIWWTALNETFRWCSKLTMCPAPGLGLNAPVRFTAVNEQVPSRHLVLVATLKLLTQSVSLRVD
jgi:hypothetical protein